VTGTITSSAGEEPGTFVCYIGTYPDKFAVARSGILKEVERIRDEPPTDEEVADAKKYLLGSLPFKLTTNAHVAEQLVNAERFGLGFGYLDDYRKAVEAVTPADVAAVAKKYLDPSRIVLIAAGPVDAKGKPLAGE
jgi:zinc protease